MPVVWCTHGQAQATMVSHLFCISAWNQQVGLSQRMCSVDIDSIAGAWSIIWFISNSESARTMQ